MKGRSGQDLPESAGHNLHMPPSLWRKETITRFREALPYFLHIQLLFSKKSTIRRGLKWRRRSLKPVLSVSSHASLHLPGQFPRRPNVVHTGTLLCLGISIWAASPNSHICRYITIACSGNTGWPAPAACGSPITWSGVDPGIYTHKHPSLLDMLIPS